MKYIVIISGQLKFFWALGMHPATNFQTSTFLSGSRKSKMCVVMYRKFTLFFVFVYLGYYEKNTFFVQLQRENDRINVKMSTFEMCLPFANPKCQKIN